MLYSSYMYKTLKEVEIWILDAKQSENKVTEGGTVTVRNLNL